MTTKTVLIEATLQEGEEVGCLQVVDEDGVEHTAFNFRIVPPQPQPAMRVPEGYVLVPEQCGGCGAESHEHCYRPGEKSCFREFNNGKTREPYAAPAQAGKGEQGRDVISVPRAALETLLGEPPKYEVVDGLTSFSGFGDHLIKKAEAIVELRALLAQQPAEGE